MFIAYMSVVKSLTLTIRLTTGKMLHYLNMQTGDKFALYKIIYMYICVCMCAGVWMRS